MSVGSCLWDHVGPCLWDHVGPCLWDHVCLLLSGLSEVSIVGNDCVTEAELTKSEGKASKPAGGFEPPVIRQSPQDERKQRRKEMQ